MLSRAKDSIATSRLSKNFAVIMWRRLICSHIFRPEDLAAVIGEAKISSLIMSKLIRRKPEIQFNMLLNVSAGIAQTFIEKCLPEEFLQTGRWYRQASEKRKYRLIRTFFIHKIYQQ